MSTCRRAFICVLVAASLVAETARAADEPQVSCARCIVVAEGGTVLWARNPRDRFPNASTTKMVTAILVMREADPGEVVTVSSTAGSIGGGGMDLAAGESYTVDALMHAMLLDSSNEAAQALAEYVAGSGEAFVARMNRYLRTIGARRSHFANPHGLDAEGHYASAVDLALIGSKLVGDPYLASVVAKADATIATPDGPLRLENRNELLEGYEGAIGIKTGRTLGAGNVLVAAAERDGDRLITVAMNSYDSFADSAALLDFGWAELRRLERIGPVLETGEEIGEVVYDSGSIVLVAGEDLDGIVPRRDAELSIAIDIDELSIPVKDGEIVGTATVAVEQRMLGVTKIGTVPVIARATGAESNEDAWWAAPIAGVVSFLGRLIA